MAFTAIFAFLFSPGIWQFHSWEIGSKIFAGILGAWEMGTREWKPYWLGVLLKCKCLNCQIV